MVVIPAMVGWEHAQGQLTGIIFPMFWGAAFKFFNEMDLKTAPVWLRWCAIFATFRPLFW